MASEILVRASSAVLAWLVQPGRDGHRARKPPDSCLTIPMLTFIVARYAFPPPCSTRSPSIRTTLFVPAGPSSTPNAP